ncbi:MAG: glycosyltransferase [Actinomycetota bacterium]|nr:glycosyltransferase [Actinomycetota bacterium]
MSAANVSALLESLSRQTVKCEVIVVDNASPDAEVTKACGDFDFAEARRLEYNAGFSRAVNIAASEAGGKALVLVNDDSVCEPGFVEEICSTLDPDRGTMMAAGVMRDVRAPDRIETAGIEIDHTLLAFDYLNGEALSILEDELAEPLGPSGAAAAYWREAFLSVGGFDERLFAYWEDVDLALRMGVRGFRCALARRALGTHVHSATLGSGSPRKNYLMGFGRGYVLRKWSALRPSRLPAILARDLFICAGQLALDRNAGGIRGRAAGLREPVEAERYPGELIESSPGHGLRGSLRQRVQRRLRLRR